MSIFESARRRLPGPLRGLWERAREHEILLHASSLAFYALVSVAPVVIVSLWLMSLVVGDQQVRDLASKLKEVAPQKLGADDAMMRVAELGTRVGVPAVVAALWPATAYGAGLKRALEHVSPAAKKDLRGVRGRGLAVFALLPVFAVGGLLASYLGTTLLGDSGAVVVIGWILGLIGAFVFVSVTVAIIYRVYAPDDLPLAVLARGAAACAAGVAVVSLGFTIYLRIGADFAERYASSGLAAVVLLAVWLFVSNVLLIVGYKVALESR